MLLIWDFAVDQTQTAAAEAPKVPTRETLLTSSSIAGCEFSVSANDCDVISRMT